MAPWTLMGGASWMYSIGDLVLPDTKPSTCTVRPHTCPITALHCTGLHTLLGQQSWLHLCLIEKQEASASYPVRQASLQGHASPNMQPLQPQSKPWAVLLATVQHLYGR